MELWWRVYLEKLEHPFNRPKYQYLYFLYLVTTFPHLALAKLANS